MNSEQTKNGIRLFLLIALGISAILEGIIIVTGQMSVTVILLYTPMIAAIIAKVCYFRNEKRVLHFTLCHGRYLLQALILPVIYLTIPYCIYWGLKPSSMKITWNGEMIGNLTLGLLSAMVAVIGEEIGWRGFLVPKLAKTMGVTKSLILSGFIWGAWHLPLVVSGIYLPDAPIWYITPVFLITITAVGVMIGIVTLQSKSILPAIILHAVHNNLSNDILGKGTIGENKIYFAGETGILTIVLAVSLAIWMYHRYLPELRKEYEKN